MLKLYKKEIFLNKKTLTGVLFLVIFSVIFFAQSLAAATYTWDNGGGDGLWSTCTNWSSDVCPDSSDYARFDGTSTDDSTIDDAFGGSVRGFDINDGYTGTITQQKNLYIGSYGYTQDAGTVKQGTYIFDINDGSFRISAGTFETGLGVSRLENSLTIDGSAVYVASSTKVWEFNGGGSADDSYLTCTGEFGGTIAITKTNDGGSFVLESGCVATTTDSISMSGSVTNHGTLHLGTTLNLANSFSNTGTATFQGTDIYVEQDFNQSGTMDLTGVTLHLDGGGSADDSVLSCVGALDATLSIDKSADGANVVINSGCIATTTASLNTAGAITNDGELHFGTSVVIQGDFSNTGTTTYEGSAMYVEGNFTQNGVFDLEGKIVNFSGGSSADDGTLSCSGSLGGLIDVTKSSSGGSFILASGCSATSTTITSSGSLTIDGTLETEGNRLSGGSLDVSSGGVLIVHADQTLTSPTLDSGSTIVYNGSDSYTSLTGGYDMHHVVFDDGTYNLISDMQIAGDLTNSGAVFNQTSGTTTFTGTANTIRGDNTFYNLAKVATDASVLTFSNGDTQTVDGVLTLKGFSTDNRLTLQSDSEGDQWFIESAGIRNLDFLEISETNNNSVTAVNCYDIDCLDGGFNLNIDFTRPEPTYRLMGGTRLRGGTRL